MQSVINVTFSKITDPFSVGVLILHLQLHPTHLPSLKTLINSLEISQCSGNPPANMVCLVNTDTTFTDIILDSQDRATIAMLDERLWENYNINPQILIHHTLSIKNTHFKPKSIFNPTHIKGAFIETFYNMEYYNILNMCNAGSFEYKNNLSKGEKNALKTLEGNNEIVFKPADKGSGVLILIRTD